MKTQRLEGGGKPAQFRAMSRRFYPMEALTAERGHENPEMRALMSRATAASNFMRLP